MAIPIETWYYEIPIVTRIYLTLAALISLGVQTGFIHPLQMYFNYDLIVNDRQYWRLVTNFLFFGPLSLDFLFHMFFLARYSLPDSLRQHPFPWFIAILYSRLHLVPAQSLSSPQHARHLGFFGTLPSLGHARLLLSPEQLDPHRRSYGHCCGARLLFLRGCLAPGETKWWDEVVKDPWDCRPPL
ncbi:hypothetical protein BC937DRAFT_92330 [Endogone sp. FLAS-F59071]|nr:hypothetical protein BC937DRAFT_92330 [Endogone sp. FLAS-F59071]|eukprot:RUS21540.1 hypothetical protein BC937DRAFT_92330 [Endogone sp. FLAS-F59071]